MAFKDEKGTLEHFLEKVNRFNPNANLELIEKAYKYAKEVHAGQKRGSGEEFFVHPEQVARILIGLRADTDTICAALLHDTVEDTSTSIATVVELFGKDIARLVEGVTKTQGIHFSSKEEYKAENLRKILLATTKDIRVILIRLADRLHNMRTLSTFRDEKRKRIAKETLDIYAPIAHKLGVWKIKGELEDLSLRYLDFDTYRKLKEQIAEKRTERERTTREIVKQINESLKDKNVQAEVTGRAKYFYSVYKKMMERHKDFDEIYDLIAIRIITKTIPDCYTALDVINNLYEREEGRMKDYIAHPKANGYQSLHTNVTRGRKLLEVQIRTTEMHHFAEEGIAAHWRYKHTERDKKFDRRIIWLKQVLDWLRKSKNAVEFVETLRIDLFENEIIVFTPKGDPISLPEGATAVDFAYAVHSNIGNHCSKTKVNNKIEPLDHELNSGDIVEVITQNNAKPSRSWLNFAKTNKARSKIRVSLGIEGEHRPKADRQKAEQLKGTEMSSADVIDLIEVQGKKAPIRLSKCCNPRLADAVVGFYTKDGKITVHKTQCINMHTLDPEKQVKLKWLEPESAKFTKIRVHVEDRPGILVEILNILALSRLPVKSVNTRTRKRKIMLTFKVGLTEDLDLDNIVKKIRSIHDVNEVQLDT